MAKYRTRPREIEAFRWWRGVDIPSTFFPHVYLAGSVFLSCQTKQGTVQAVPGDWLILGDGEVYPCKPEEFEKRYEPVPFADQPVDERSPQELGAQYKDYKETIDGT